MSDEAKWWVVRAGATYTVVRDDARPGRGTRLGRWAATREAALVNAERAANKHAREASGGLSASVETAGQRERGRHAETVGCAGARCGVCGGGGGNVSQDRETVGEARQPQLPG